MGYSQLLMSRIKSILKDSDSQWSLLTVVTTTHHHRSPSSQGKNRKKKETEKEIVIARYYARIIYIINTQNKSSNKFLHIRDAESN